MCELASTDGSVIEVAAQFGEQDALVGVAAFPSTTPCEASPPAILILNAGQLPRSAPHRLQVDLARSLARVGYSSLRFDFRGLGDSRLSPSESHDESTASRDIVAAMDWMRERTGVKSFVLLGLCAGARKAIRAALLDDRVCGLILANGYFDLSWLYSPSSDIKNRVKGRYYWKRLRSPRAWGRLLSGKSNVRSLLSVVRYSLANAVHPPVDVKPDRGLGALGWGALMDRNVHVLLYYTEGSETLDAYRAHIESQLRAFRKNPLLSIEILKNADHVFTLLWSQQEFADYVCSWLSRLSVPSAYPLGNSLAAEAQGS